MQSSTSHKPIKVFIDENLPKQFAQAFNTVQSHLNKTEKKKIEVYSMKELHEGRSDIEWFKALKDDNAVILTYDRNMQRHKHERLIYQQNGIGVIFFKHPKGGLQFWTSFKHVVKWWDDIKQICRKNNVPFAFRQPGMNNNFVCWNYEDVG